MARASNDENAEQNHWSECGRATSVPNSGALGRPHRSVLPFGDLMRYAQKGAHPTFGSHHVGCHSCGLVLGAPSTAYAPVLPLPDRLDASGPCPAHLAFPSCTAGVGQHTARLHAMVTGRD